MLFRSVAEAKAPLSSARQSSRGIRIARGEISLDEEEQRRGNLRLRRRARNLNLARSSHDSRGHADRLARCETFLKEPPSVSGAKIDEHSKACSFVAPVSSEHLDPP